MMQGNVPRIMEFEVYLLYKVYKKYFRMSKFTKILFLPFFLLFYKINWFNIGISYAGRIWKKA